MKQLDFIGSPPHVEKPFSDIRNTRPSVAEKKAALSLELGKLCRRVPPNVASGSIQSTREWVAAQKAALTTVKSKRASVQELTAAISNMRRLAG